MTIRKYVVVFVFLFGCISVIPAVQGLDINNLTGIAAYPTAGAVVHYKGTCLTSPVNFTLTYTTFNATHLAFSYSLYNETDSSLIQSWCGSGLDEVATRLISEAQGTQLPTDSHMWRITPSELNAVGNRTLLAFYLPRATPYDCYHSVSSEGSMDVTGRRVNYWILNATRPYPISQSGYENRTFYFEKTTGICLKIVTGNYNGNFYTQGLDLTIQDATNIIPYQIAGFDVLLVIASAGIIVILLSKKIYARSLPKF